MLDTARKSNRRSLVYVIVLVGLLALTVVMSRPGIALGIMYVTLGLATPFAFAGTALVYGICAAPAIFLWDYRGKGRVVGIATTAALVGLAALSPWLIGRLQVKALAAHDSGSDLRPAQAVAAETVEIRRPDQNYAFEGLFEEQAACGAECRDLLAAGTARWIRVVSVARVQGRNPGERIVSRTVFGLASEGCAAPGQPGKPAACVVVLADPPEPAQLTIEVSPELIAVPAGWKPGPFDFALRKGVVHVTAWTQAPDEPIYRQTEVDFSSPIFPSLWGPRISSSNSEGLDIVRSSKRVRPVTLRLTLHELGLLTTDGAARSVAVAAPQTDGRADVDEASTRQLLSVLDLPQTEAFNPDQAKIVATWILQARKTVAWTPDRLELLRRIVRDRRLRSPTGFDQIFERNPKVAAALIGDVLDRIDEEGISRDYTIPRQVAYTFPRLAPGFLLPYAARIEALMAKGGAVREILLPAAGQLGVDPAPYLLPFDDEKRSPGIQRGARLRGACYADKRWATELIGPLRAYLEQARTPDQRRAVFFALANLGDRDFVAARIAADGRPQEARLVSRIDRVLGNAGRQPNALCGPALF